MKRRGRKVNSFGKKLYLIFLSYFTTTGTVLTRDLATYQQQYFPSYKQHRRVSARNMINRGIGYDHGYTTVETFLAPNPTSHTFIPFLDLRGHVFNDGKMAANAGIGLRKSLNCTVYGLNVYYDYRDTAKMHYNQIGLGAEVLSPLYDLRINSYFPVRKKITEPYNTEFAGFTGHNMLISQDYQFAMKGFSAEVGFHAGKAKFLEFYTAVGPYYFTEPNGPNLWGGKIRLTCKFQDYFTIELSNSYDHYFRNRFQCQFTFNLPFGGHEEVNRKSDCNKPSMLASRMVQPVERQEIIVQGSKKQNSIAIDPTTNEPFYFVFVDNTSHSNGTYESPYPTLTLAQDNSKPGDIIYVYPGDGTATGMDSGITLKNKQKFWGSGISHALQTTQGNIVILAQSSATPNITYSNILGSDAAITLASINDVSGFKITNAINSGIRGNATKDITISDCVIDHSGTSGSTLSKFNQIHLKYSDTTGVAILKNLTIINGDLSGIFIDSTASNTTATIDRCVFHNNAEFTINGSFANQANVSLTNNVMENNVNGCYLQFTGPATLVVSGNDLSNTTSISEAPLKIQADVSPIVATIENNNIHDNFTGGVYFSLNNTDSAQLNVNHNTFLRNGSGAESILGSAIVIDPNGTSTGNCQLNLTDNTISNNHNPAPDNSPVHVFYSASGGSFNNFQINATNNTITNNTGGGLLIESASDTLSLAIKNNVISGGGDNAIFTSGSLLIDTANVVIDHNQITGNTGGAGGIAFSHDGTNLDMTITNNNISDNDSSGIVVYSGAGIENMTANIANNTINNNQNANFNAASGIDLEQFINFTGVITDNTLANNVIGFPDVYVGSTETTPAACLELSGNRSDNGYVLSNDTGTFNLAPCNVNAVNTGTITTIGSGTITPVKSCPNAEICS